MFGLSEDAMAGNRESFNRCVWQETVNRGFESVGRERWPGNKADVEGELYKSMGNNWAISAGRKELTCGEVKSLVCRNRKDGNCLW